MAISGSEYVDITCVNSSGDLTSSQYYIVRTTGVDSAFSAGNMTCKICTGSSGGINGPKGILQNDPDTGQAAIVRVLGLSKCVCGEAVGVGDLITSSTAGTGIKADTTGAFFLGRAESATTAAGDMFYVRIQGLSGPFMGSTA